jgi:hypothetical protein
MPLMSVLFGRDEAASDECDDTHSDQLGDAVNA